MRDFLSALFGKTNSSGYTVIVDYGTVKMSHGPYSQIAIARECASEFIGSQNCCIINATTGEELENYPVIKN